MLKKVVSVFVIMLLMTGTLSACGSSDDNSTDSPTVGTEATNPPANNNNDSQGDDNNNDSNEATGDDNATAEEDPFPASDLGGVTLNIRLNDGDNPDKADEAQKEKWAERKAAVEEKFNVNLNFNVMEGVEWNDVPDHIVTSIASGNPAVDSVFNLSRYWVDTLATNDVLVDMTDAVIDFNIPDAYFKYGCEWIGRTVGFNVSRMGAPGIMVFNRDMIKAAGMDKDPGEMFAAGQWSHEDFFSYLTELKTKLPADIHPLRMHVLHWIRGTSYANGAGMLDPDSYLISYNSTPFYDAIELYARVLSNNLAYMPDPAINEETGEITGYYWSTATIGDGDAAITFAEEWQFGDIASKMDFGVVPFPWGPNVTIENNDYTTLSSNYNSFFVDNNLIVLMKHAENKINPTQLMNLAFSYFTDQAEQLLIDREKVANGQPVESADAGTLRNFYTDLDVELWDWFQTRIKFEPYESVNPGVLYGVLSRIAAQNLSARSALEAILGQHLYLLIESGINTRDMLPDDLKALVDEYSATVTEEGEN